MEKLETYAKKTFLALKNPYCTVNQVYPRIIDLVAPSLEKHGFAWYIGIKDTPVIPEKLKERLNESGFLFHTADKMALGGRAVDLQLINPITGKWMTGSSSGTALNVFYGINDAGIGTDGGGSVLAPAAALNLYGFISPLIEQDHMRQHSKASTDGIVFSPSLGAITRDLETLEQVLDPLLGISLTEESNDWNTAWEWKEVPKGGQPDIYGRREPLIQYLNEIIRPGTILISREGPVDVNAMGDSIYGHFDKDTERCQALSGKGLMRVVNMCGKSALTVPSSELGCCTVLICESKKEDIEAMFRKARLLACKRSRLTQRYFMNFDMYF
ncbi:amidase family protein [Lacrimispora sp.]|uniref:amidase family protein n=1 Tax=Lacrimispora sp. TaxID=2719234 RepID=UPI0028A13A08|nr:amidase family protein [Lacrimispora sp.]